MGTHFTSESRFRRLMELEKELKTDTHGHMSLGAHMLKRELPQLKATIFAQVYGILSEGQAHDTSRRAFRWLLAHTDNSKISYNPSNPTQQWRNIMEYYFRKFHGHYAEVALLERILLSVFRAPQTDMPLSDLFMADRAADYNMMSDWIMHQTMTHGKLQMGIQLATGKGASSKRNDFHKRPLHDRNFFQSADVPDVVRDFLRHNTAILAFPRFKTAEQNRARALRYLLSGSPRYQSYMIATTGNRTFNNYGRQVMEILRFFHAGVIDRVIDHRARLSHHEFSQTNTHGETISGSIYEHE